MTTMEPTTIPAIIPPLLASKVDSEVGWSLLVTGVGSEVVVVVVLLLLLVEVSEDVDVEVFEDDERLVGVGELVANAPTPKSVRAGMGYTSSRFRRRAHKVRYKAHTGGVPVTCLAAATNAL